MHQAVTTIKILRKTGMPDNKKGGWFVMEVDETGQPVYHWKNSRIDQLSSAKLVDVLCLYQANDLDVDEDFIDAVESELHSRNFYLESDLMEVSGC